MCTFIVFVGAPGIAATIFYALCIMENESHWMDNVSLVRQRFIGKE